jgi:asparagine N-glycosylation enzyme membrane subunit Stt3
MTPPHRQQVFQVWALTFLAALYLLRGLLEFPAIGWAPQTVLTVVIGLGVLPALAALAATSPPWRRAVLVGLCLAGSVINAALLVVLWNGLTWIAALTLLIVVLYGAVAGVEGRRPK